MIEHLNSVSHMSKQERVMCCCRAFALDEKVMLFASQHWKLHVCMISHTNHRNISLPTEPHSWKLFLLNSWFQCSSSWKRIVGLDEILKTHKWYYYKQSMEFFAVMGRMAWATVTLINGQMSSWPITNLAQQQRYAKRMQQCRQSDQTLHTTTTTRNWRISMRWMWWLDCRNGDLKRFWNWLGISYFYLASISSLCSVSRGPPSRHLWIFSKLLHWIV